MDLLCIFWGFWKKVQKKFMAWTSQSKGITNILNYIYHYIFYFNFIFYFNYIF